MTLEQRTLGTTASLTVSALGLGCMGMSEFYGTADEQRGASRPSTAPSTSASPSSTPPTCTARSPTSSWSARRSPAGATRSLLATKFGNVRARGRQPGRHQRHARSTSARPATPRCSGSASTTSTSTTSTASTRPSRSRRPSARWPSWSQAGKVRHLGLSEAGADDHPPRRTPCTRSPRCRPSTRCGPATSRTRSCRRCRELGIGFVPYRPLGRGFLTGAITAARRPRRRTTSAAALPALPGRELRREPRRSSTQVAGDRRREGRARPASSRSPGCSPRATTSCRSRAPSGVTYLEENVGAADGRAHRRRPRRARGGRPARRRGRRPLRRHVHHRRLTRGVAG